MTVVPRRLLADVVDARAKSIPNITVYRRRVSDTPPAISPIDPRVRPYVVQHPSAGMTGEDIRLDGSSVGLAWTFQLTCATGDEFAIDSLADLVTAKFEGWRPSLGAEIDDIVSIGRCRQLNDPGSGRRDDAVSPPRYWTPLIFGIHLGS